MTDRYAMDALASAKLASDHDERLRDHWAEHGPRLLETLRAAKGAINRNPSIAFAISRNSDLKKALRDDVREAIQAAERVPE